MIVVFSFADGGDDVGAAVLADESHLSVTEGGEVAGAVVRVDLGRVFTTS